MHSKRTIRDSRKASCCSIVLRIAIPDHPSRDPARRLKTVSKFTCRTNQALYVSNSSGRSICISKFRKNAGMSLYLGVEAHVSDCLVRTATRLYKHFKRADVFPETSSRTSPKLEHRRLHLCKLRRASLCPSLRPKIVNILAEDL